MFALLILFISLVFIISGCNKQKQYTDNQYIQPEKNTINEDNLECLKECGEFIGGKEKCQELVIATVNEDYSLNQTAMQDLRKQAEYCKCVNKYNKAYCDAL